MAFFFFSNDFLLTRFFQNVSLFLFSVFFCGSERKIEPFAVVFLAADRQPSIMYLYLVSDSSSKVEAEPWRLTRIILWEVALCLMGAVSNAPVFDQMLTQA